MKCWGKWKRSFSPPLKKEKPVLRVAVRDKNIKKGVDMNSIGDIMKGGISAILIALGYVVLWCGIVYLI